MRPDRVYAGPWARVLALALVGCAGLLSLVGSGGGFPPCDAPWCDDEYTPPATAYVTPRYVTAQVGSPVTFTAQISGFSGGISYRWSRSSDGAVFTDIPGATGSSLTLPAVNLGDDGAYIRLSVRSTSGAADQDVGRLLVNATPGIVLSDGDFASGRWHATPRENPTGVLPAHSETFETGGGAPGAWLSMLYQIPPGAGSASVVYLRDEATYDPAAQGAIRVIDYAEDCRALVASDLRYAESHLVIEQAGRRYAAVHSNVCKEQTWSGVANRASLAASDFTLTDGPGCAAAQACQDFSAGAPPLRFGFRRFVWGAPGDTIGHGIDNWTVTVWRR